METNEGKVINFPRKIQNGFSRTVRDTNIASLSKQHTQKRFLGSLGLKMKSHLWNEYTWKIQSLRAILYINFPTAWIKTLKIKILCKNNIRASKIHRYKSLYKFYVIFGRVWIINTISPLSLSCVCLIGYFYMWHLKMSF